MTPSIGDTLREARNRRGLELSDVVDETKIRAKYLRALEEERWHELPEGPYARGFLVTYAEFLELDPEPLVADYRRVSGGEEPPLLTEAILPTPGEARAAPLGWIGAIAAGLLAVAAVGVVIAITSGGSDDGGRDATRHATPGRQAGSHPAGGGEQTAPARVTVELRSLGEVWVCLIDDRDRRLVNGETLTEGETRGPFRASRFRVGFGNGSVRLEVDGDPVAVPQLAEPLGYRISPDGERRLAESSRPTCL